MAGELKRQRAGAKRQLTNKLRLLSNSIEDGHPVQDVGKVLDEVINSSDHVEESHDAYLEAIEEQGEVDDTAEDWIGQERSRVRKARNDYVAYLKQQKTSTSQDKVEEGTETMFKLKFGRELHSFTVSAQRFQDRIIDQESSARLEANRKTLYQTFERLELVYAKLCSLGIGEGDYYENIVDARNKLTEVDDDMIRLMGSGETTTDTSNPIPRTDYHHRNSVKVEPIKLPTFCGGKDGYSQWPAFISTWKKIAEVQWPREYLNHALYTHLEGEASKLVEATQHDYDEMIRILSKKFGDSMKAAETILGEVQSYKPITNENHKGLTEFIDTVLKAHTKLSALGMPNEMRTCTAIGEIEKRLPPKVREDWANIITRKPEEDRKQPYEIFLGFLKEEKDKFEYLASTVRQQSSPKQVSVKVHLQKSQQVTPGSDKHCFACGEAGHFKRECPQRDSYSTETSVTKAVVKSYVCVVCNGKHRTKDCEQFNKMSLTDRRSRFKTNGGCFKCLGKGHLAQNCRWRDNECTLCGSDRHHRLLCSRPTGSSVNDSRVNKDKEENTNVAIKSDSTSSYAADIGKAGSDRNTLLHIMSVACGKQGVHLNVLWDTGSAGNFITHSSAERNGFRYKNCMVEVTTLNNTRERHDTKIYEVVLRDKAGNGHQLYAYGLESISGDVEALNYQIVRDTFTDLDESLVSTLCRTSGKVDLLIGNEKAGWQPFPYQSDGNHLLVMQNKFGTCLGGTHPHLRDRTQRDHVWTDVHHVLTFRTDIHPLLLSKDFSGSQCEFQTMRAYKVDMEDDDNSDSFFKAESLGLEVNPRCGACKYGKSPTTGHSYTFQEDRELNLIRERLEYNNAGLCWMTKYPWIEALFKTASFFSNTYPDAARMIRYSTYVDDIVDSHTTGEECRELGKQATEVKAAGGFQVKGWCSFTMKAKMLLRETWMTNLGWNDTLPENMRLNWLRYFQLLFEGEHIRFDRCVRPENATGQPMFITFSDGSELGYGAVAYILWITTDGKISTKLLLAKGRVAAHDRATLRTQWCSSGKDITQ